MSVRIFYDETKFRLKGWKKSARIITEIIENKMLFPGDINVIVTNDSSLRKINVMFLKHDFDTDVITFNDNKGKIVNGEIYIGLGKVIENSLNYNVSLNSEISRVIFHGVLHLVGYDDKTKIQKNEMKKWEEFWIKRLNDL